MIDDKNKDIDYKKIGELIKTNRKRNHLSQQELANRVFVNNQHISRIERGKVNLSLELLLLIANTLKVSANDLLEGNLNYTISDSDKDTDKKIREIFSECSKDEETILLRTLQFLKDLLSEYGI